MKVYMSKLSPRLLIGIIVALFFGVALYFRVCLPYDQVFGSEWVKLTGVDAYYHMRLVDNLVHNFPHLTGFDPYFIYPGGRGIGSISFFDWLLASIIWVIGLGSPTQHTIDVVGVYFPAVLGALTVIPVYFIGKELFGRWAGVLSAGLIALLPGEFLGRSILGFTDHHVAETLFTTVTILFLVLAIKTARQRQLTFSHLKRRDWATITKPIIYSLLTGIFLGIYLLTWAGALLFVFIISIYFIIQFIIDHLKDKSADYLCVVGVILFFVALLMFLPVSPGMLYLVSLVVALFVPLVLSGVSWLMASKEIKPAYYPLTLVGLGLAGLGIFYAIAPSLLSSMLGQFSIFTPTGVQLTTIEMQPLLFPQGNLSLSVAWGNFTTGFFISFISLGILIYLVIKQGGAEKSLLVVWSLVILAAALGQRRFAYYLVVNIALLTGYFSVLVYYVIRFIIDYLRGERTDYMSWQILSLAGFKEGAAKPAEIPRKLEKAKRGKRREARFRLTTSHISISLWVIVVFFVVFFPNIGPATATAKQARFAPSDAWCSSLSWLKENTPDPFGDPDFYYELHESPFQYPESAYGVMAWWDYGYWITRIAHRLPNANPSQSRKVVTSVASLFTSQDENSAQEIIQEMGSSYIIIDYQTATGKFWAIATWAGREQAEYFDVYYVPQQNQLVPVQLFYPEYYRSFVVRLYNFDGKAVTPEGSIVISYQQKVSREGKPYKEITSVEQFDSYEEAEAYFLSQESANYKIVSDNPFISPVPLEALKHYKLIHSSDSHTRQPTGETIPSVKIFEYTD
ncbi:hypothetical protein ES706_03959 [subsurface metagenome]